MANPYHSPVYDGSCERFRRKARRYSWLVWPALGWVMFLIANVPSFNVKPTPAGTFLSYKIVTTVISTVAFLLLTWAPRGWWKVLTIPFALLLVLVEIAAWRNLP